MSSNSALKKASKTKSLSLSQDDFIFPRAPRIRKTQKLEDTQKIFKYIDDNIIGKGVLFLGPYGRRKGEFIFQVQVLKRCITAHIMNVLQKEKDL